MPVIEKLITVLGFDYDSKGFDKFKEGVGQVKETITSLQEGADRATVQPPLAPEVPAPATGDTEKTPGAPPAPGAEGIKKKPVTPQAPSLTAPLDAKKSLGGGTSKLPPGVGIPPEVRDSIKQLEDVKEKSKKAKAGLSNFASGVRQVTQLLKRLTQTLIGSTTALVGFAVASANITAEQSRMANQIGITVAQLDALQIAGELAGDSAGGITSGLNELAVKASEASRGLGSGVEAFGLLGISAMTSNGEIKSSVQLLQEVSGALQGVSRARQIELAGKLGLGSSLRLLQAGPGAMQKYIASAQTLGATTDAQGQSAIRLTQSLTILKKTLAALGRVIMVQVAPFVEVFVKHVTNWWSANRKIIDQRFPEIINAMVAGFKLLTTAVGIFIALKLVSSMAGVIVSFRSLAALVAVSTGGIGLMAIAFVAFVFAVQDAYSFFQGKESIIGDMLKDFPKHRETILTIATALGTVADMAILSAKGLALIFKTVSDSTKESRAELLNDLPEMLRLMSADVEKALRDIDYGLIEEGFRLAWEDFKNFAKLQIDTIGIMIGEINFDSLKKSFLKVWESIKETISTQFDSAFPGLTKVISVFTEDKKADDQGGREEVTKEPGLISRGMSKAKTFVSGVLDTGVSALGKLKKVVTDFSLKAVLEAFLAVGKVSTSVFDGVVAEFKRLISDMLSNFPSLYAGVEKIAGVFTAAKNKVSDTYSTFYKELFAGMKNVGAKMVKVTTDVMGSIVGMISTATKKAFSSLIAKLTGTTEEETPGESKGFFEGIFDAAIDSGTRLLNIFQELGLQPQVAVPEAISQDAFRTSELNRLPSESQGHTVRGKISPSNTTANSNITIQKVELKLNNPPGNTEKFVEGLNKELIQVAKEISTGVRQ
ncbi:MAG: hypothetical protein DRJ03_03230 [Chloroflexi bacterium]|nr:MAG: hypothetical protein DRJ03_03230 [Chloroflexota bacterium]